MFAKPIIELIPVDLDAHWTTKHFLYNYIRGIKRREKESKEHFSLPVLYKLKCKLI